MKKTPTIVWIPALVFTSALLIFLMVAFYTTPNFTESQRGIVSLIFPLLAGFSALFLGGTVLFEVAGTTRTGLNVSLSATAGIAVFLICYFNPPPFVQRFVGHYVEGTVDLLYRHDRVVDESNSIRSATVRTGQDGDTQGTRVSIDLPPGAFDIKHKEFWNCDCTKSSRSWIEGNKIIAEGTITSPSPIFGGGPRVWGELFIEASWKRKVIDETIKENSPLPRLAVAIAPAVYSITDGIPVRTRLNFFDARAKLVDSLSAGRAPGSSPPTIQSSDHGTFTAAVADTAITVTRNAN